ncbi:hypothetical protein GCM10010156_21150 [Planobispora rosea]|uniref:Uncharacterized protein n=1 Tax=Planobispora rosea TaxID=35762 RepID=A0A8J3S233_PLARO|nr:hypothetical protein [Planobispora rosea]GGS62129.1 hypothetical protein GCM10010156_21150 [Planobispora rosea]GIH84372.1 hypothetical protein Pro02_27800 [Planobispora rosea]
MPRPGSHSYDKERARLRQRLEKQGLSEDELKERVNKSMQSDPDKRPRKATARADGPKAERPSRGRQGGE